MKYSRRSFLKTSGALATGLAVGTLPFLKSCAPAGEEYSPFGLQLYTLRDVIGDDPQGTIRQVAEFGYSQIESYEGRQGIFWGMSNTDFKSFLDDLGVKMISSHANVFNNYEEKVEQLAEIGVPYITCPYVGQQDSIDEWKEMAETFNNLGQIAKDAGLQFAYHNHAYTFEEVDGQLPHTILMEETDAELVKYQMDIYWVAVAGEDPVEWMRQYPNRFTSCHIKDLGGSSDEPESVTLGNGSLDFPVILSEAEKYGMVQHIVEQEAYTGTSPMDAVQANAEYMKNLDI